MNLEIYNMSRGYRSKDDYAEHIAYYYGRNVYKSNELFVSDENSKLINDVSDDIARFVFITYDKQSTNSYNYIESHPFWINDLKFYTNWNFHSVNDIMNDAINDYHNNRSNKNKFFFKDSNRKINHPISIKFVSKNDFSTTAARNDFREIADDDNFETDFKKPIEISYSSEILIMINFDWFYNNIIKQNKSQNILSSYLSRELMHVFEQYQYFSNNNLSMLVDVQNDVDMQKDFYEIWNECSYLIYLLYNVEEEIFLRSAEEFLDRITTEKNSIRRNMIKEACHIPDSFATIDVNKQLTNIVLSNIYFNKISFVGQFKDKINDLKTTDDSNIKTKVIVLTGYYLFKYNKLDFTSNKVTINISNDKARQFFSRELVCNFLKDMLINSMSGVSLTEFIDFVMLNIENMFIDYEMKVVKLIWKYIEKIFNDDFFLSVKFDSEHLENTIIDVKLNCLIDPIPEIFLNNDKKENKELDYDEYEIHKVYNYVKM